jgi:excisionase family DNA binding protein
MRRNEKTQDQPTLWEQAPASRPQQRPAPVPLPAHRPVKPMEHQELWTVEDVANYLGVPKQTVYAWRTSGYGPQGFRVGKHVRWRATTVIAWTLGLEQQQ